MASYGNGGGFLNEDTSHGSILSVGAVNGPASAHPVSFTPMTPITPTSTSQRVNEARTATPTLGMGREPPHGPHGAHEAVKNFAPFDAKRPAYSTTMSAQYASKNANRAQLANTTDLTDWQKQSAGIGSANGLLRTTYAQIKSGTVTNAALVQLMSDSMNLQVSRAKDVNAPPQMEISGDAAVRRTIQTLLSYPQQRQLFRDLVGSNNGERIRALFGAPPYSFLCEGDSLLLDAAGIAHGRVNMAYDSMRVPNYSQFGVATCMDQKGREYRLHMRVDASQANDEDRLAALGVDAVQIALDASHDGACELICRIPRTKRLRNDSREEMLESGQEVVFLAQGLPSMNEVLTLTDAPALKSVSKASLFAESIQLLVRGVTSSSPRASTGRIRVSRAGR